MTSSRQPDLLVSAVVADAGDHAAARYVEFFAARIRDRNTRATYTRAAAGFLAWCERAGLRLGAVQPVHVAAWVEGMAQDGLAAPAMKQNLAAACSHRWKTEPVHRLKAEPPA